MLPFAYGETVEVVEGPLAGCLATVRDFPGLRIVGDRVCNAVEALVARRRFTFCEDQLAATDRTEGKTL